MSEVLSIGDWSSNAAMIADVAKLGYLDGVVFDATYGRGGFWKDWKPETLTTSDINADHGTDHAWDYLRLPLGDGVFDAVVFDPPYKLNGTPALGEQDDRYGTNRRTSRAKVMEDIRAGAVECYRVTRCHLLVKCMDQVEGGQMRWQTDTVTRAIEDLGGRKVDRFDIPTAGRAQPKDRRCMECGGHGHAPMTIGPAYTPEEGDALHDRARAEHPCAPCGATGRVPIVQRTSRGKHSTLLVFRKPPQAPPMAPTLL